MASQMCVCATLLLLVSGSARAQTTGEGLLTFGAGGYSNGYNSGRVVQFGGGGQAFVTPRIGIGGDALLTAGGGDGWLEASERLEYRFETKTRTTPFVSGGYTRLGAITDLGGFNAVNFGGGIAHSFGRESIRLELRDVMLANGPRTTHYATVRVSLAFRSGRP